MLAYAFQLKCFRIFSKKHIRGIRPQFLVEKLDRLLYFHTAKVFWSQHFIIIRGVTSPLKADIVVSIANLDNLQHDCQKCVFWAQCQGCTQVSVWDAPAHFEQIEAGSWDFLDIISAVAGEAEQSHTLTRCWSRLHLWQQITKKKCLWSSIMYSFCWQTDRQEERQTETVRVDGKIQMDRAQ